MIRTASESQAQQRPSSHLMRRVLLWVFLAAAAFLVSADLVFRFAYGAGNPVLVVSDKPSGYILKPDQRVHRFGGKLVYVNDYGMRADEVPSTKPPGTERIFFIGDSVTYGSTRIDQSEIFSEQVHRQLPATIHHPVQVLNASASAWAPGNEWGYLRSRGTFGSDLVILVLNSGDIGEPFATLKDVGDGVMRVKPWCALDEVYTRVIKGKVLHLIRTEDRGTAPEETGPAQIAENISENLSNLTQFDQFVQQHGARMAIVFVPFRKFMPWGIPASAPSQLTQWSSLHGVPLLDTTDVLSSRPISAVSYDGYHLTTLGHTLVAQDIERRWTQIDPKP